MQSDYTYLVSLLSIMNTAAKLDQLSVLVCILTRTEQEDFNLKWIEID